MRTLDQWSKDLERAANGGMTDAVLKALKARESRVLGRAKALAPTRTFGLVQSLRSRTWQAGDTVRQELASSHPGAALQEHGGTVHALTKKLVVPLQAGVVWTARAGTFTLRARDGRLFLAKRVGRATELVARLVDRVTVPGRHFLEQGMQKADAKERITTAVRAHLEKGT